MNRQKVKLGGRLSGVAINPSAKLELAPPSPSDVLAFPKLPVAEPITPPPPPLPDPAELLALRKMLAELGRVTE